MMSFEIDNFTAIKEALEKMCLHLLDCSVPEERVFDSKVVASELLSNALKHGGGRARFCAELTEEGVLISVKSANYFCPPQASTCSSPSAEGGRGLFLVDAMGTRRFSEEKGITVIIRLH